MIRHPKAWSIERKGPTIIFPVFEFTNSSVVKCTPISSRDIPYPLLRRASQTRAGDFKDTVQVKKR